LAKRNRKCRLIVDSCCDLPADLVESFDVDVLHFTYIMDDGEHVDDMWTSMTSHDFYERMRKGEQPSTSQVPYGAIHQMFERVAREGTPTVYVCFTSGLSGAYESMVSIWEDMQGEYPDFEMHIVDCKLASAAEGLLVMEAVRQLDKGLSAAELADWVDEAHNYVHGYFTLDGLETLHRGGRIPDMAAVAGAKLDIKPILTFDMDGALAFFGAARGRKKSIKQLLQIFEDRFDANANNTVMVVSADAVKEQNSLTEQLLNMPYELSLWETSIGPVIGSHVGPDMIAIVFWGPDRRQSISLTDRIAKAVSSRMNSKGNTE